MQPYLVAFPPENQKDPRWLGPDVVLLLPPNPVPSLLQGAVAMVQEGTKQGMKGLPQHLALKGLLLPHRQTQRQPPALLLLQIAAPGLLLPGLAAAPHLFPINGALARGG